MTDKTHQVLGLAAATGVFFMTHPDQSVTLPVAVTIAAAAVIGSLAPDIDQPGAKLWRRMPLVGGIFGYVSSKLLGGHRNLSHSLLGTLIFGGLVALVLGTLPTSWGIDTSLAWQSAVAAFGAHLAADAVTVMGIPVFWPFGEYMGFPPYPFDGLRIMTGKWFENVVVFPLSILVVIVIVATHAGQFCVIIPALCS